MASSDKSILIYLGNDPDIISNPQQWVNYIKTCGIVSSIEHPKFFHATRKYTWANHMKIRCTGCNFEQSEPLIQKITVESNFQGFVVRYGSAMKWCKTCEKVRAVESLPDLTEAIQNFQNAADEFELACIDNYKEFGMPSCKNIWEYIAKHFDSKFRQEKRKSEQHIEYLREKKWQLHTMKDWIANRKSLPLCLTCGSTEIETCVDGFIHSCGGSLKFEADESSSMHISWSPKTYSVRVE